MDNREERIRTKAYELWEKSGRPEGQETEHWAEAERWAEARDGGEEAGTVTNPGRTGYAQADQVETVDTAIPVKRRKKASVRPTGKTPKSG